MQEDILKLSTWLDASLEGRDPEAILWQRCMKISEECGEVTEALYGMFGSNPRKGLTHTIRDVEKELLDVVVTALGAIEHINGNVGVSVDLLKAHVAWLCERVGL